MHACKCTAQRVCVSLMTCMHQVHKRGDRKHWKKKAVGNGKMRKKKAWTKVETDSKE